MSQAYLSPPPPLFRLLCVTLTVCEFQCMVSFDTAENIQAVSVGANTCDI
jgi:hypothetical protein